MILENFEQLAHQARSLPRRTAAVAAAHDPHVLEAVRDASAQGLVDYLLVGDPDKIREIAAGMDFTPDPERILPEADDVACAKRAVELVRQGRAQLLMKGKLQTSTLLREVVNKETGIGKGGLMSHVAMFQIPGFKKLLAVTDGGMVLAPDLAAKKAILENAVDFLHSLGVEEPKVAVLCPVEVVNPKIQATVDAAALAEMNRTGEISGCVVAGPISMDLALSPESAQIKGYQSPVTGDVDLLVVPDMSCGNILGKSFVYAAQAVMAGCIVGAQVPVVLTSRGSTAQEKLYSLVISSLASAK
jgi:phosphate butyryltransferase